MLTRAPFHDEIAAGPAGGHAIWLHAADGTRLRLGHWPALPGTGPRGTVLLFPGRTEYVEKYGPVARVLCAAGWHVVAIDWRGQGLSDRLLTDRNAGHVADFSHYQDDIAALCSGLAALGAPVAPVMLLGHSMGGCIGLRWAMRGAPGLAGPLAAASLSAPMWGIRMSAALRPVARLIAGGAMRLGLGRRYAPGTGPTTYLDTAAQAANMLTGDADMFAFMQRQLAAHPDLALGGPSMIWLAAALRETAELARLPSPALATYCGLGTAEAVVDPRAVHARMARWPGGRLEMFADGRHELMMEIPALRGRFLDATLDLFSRAAVGAAVGTEEGTAGAAGPPGQRATTAP